MGMRPTDITRPQSQTGGGSRRVAGRERARGLIDTSLGGAEATRGVARQTRSLAAGLRGQAQAVKANAARETNALGDFSNTQERGQQALAAAEYRVGSAEAEATRQVGQNSQEIFQKSMQVLEGVVTHFDETRKAHTDQLFEDRASLKAARAFEDVHTRVKSNPGTGKEWLDMTQEEYAKAAEKVKQEVIDELGYEPSAEQLQKIDQMLLAQQEQGIRLSVRESHNEKVSMAELEMDNNVLEAVRGVRATGDWQTGLQLAEQFVANQQGLISNSKLQAKQQAAAQSVYQAAIEKLVEDEKWDEANSLVDTLSGTVTGSATEIHFSLTEASKNEGEDPATVMAISWAESAWDATAANDKSSARGLGQFTSATGQAYGLPEDASEATVKEQARALAEHTRDNREYLETKLGRTVTPAEIYMAHFAGMGNAARIIRASDDTPTSQLFTAKELAANPHLKGKTAGWFKQWAAKKMNEGFAAINSGQVFSRKLSKNAANRGVDKVDRLGKFVRDEYKKWIPREVRRIKDSMGNMTLNQIEQTVIEYSSRLPENPDPAAPETKLFDGISKAATEIRKLRVSDPAASVANDPAVFEAYARATKPNATPEDKQALIAARMAAQEAVGVPEGAQLPFTDLEAKEYAAPLILPSKTTGRGRPSTDEKEMAREIVNNVIKTYGAEDEELLRKMLQQVAEATSRDHELGKSMATHWRKIQQGRVPDPRENLELARDMEAAMEKKALGLPDLEVDASDTVSAPRAIPSQSTPYATKKYRTPGPTAIQALHDNPKRRAEFDREYGPGASDRFLAPRDEFGDVLNKEPKNDK